MKGVQFAVGSANGEEHNNFGASANAEWRDTTLRIRGVFGRAGIARARQFDIGSDHFARMKQAVARAPPECVANHHFIWIKFCRDSPKRSPCFLKTRRARVDASPCSTVRIN